MKKYDVNKIILKEIKLKLRYRCHVCYWQWQVLTVSVWRQKAAEEQLEVTHAALICEPFQCLHTFALSLVKPSTFVSKKSKSMIKIYKCFN